MFGFFDKRVVVTFIDNANDVVLGVSKLHPTQLPDSFEIPKSLQFQDKEWYVIKAEPMHKREYLLAKKLTLYLAQPAHLDHQKIRFTMPTISNELPAMVDTKLFDDFGVELHEDDWRQIEFLPVAILSAIQQEMAEVEAILFPEEEPKGAVGYESIHVRSKIGSRHLAIPFLDFCDLVQAGRKGTISLWGHSGFVKNGFALKSPNNTYNGTVEGDVIKELCLQEFESADDEFATITEKFNLLLVSWCRGQIATI